MAAQATTTTTPQKVTQSGPTQEAVGSGEGEAVEEPPVNTLDTQVASITAFANERIEVLRQRNVWQKRHLWPKNLNQ